MCIARAPTVGFRKRSLVGGREEKPKVATTAPLHRFPARPRQRRGSLRQRACVRAPAVARVLRRTRHSAPAPWSARRAERCQAMAACWLARLRGFAGRKRYFSAIGVGYHLDIPRRYFAATAENRCSEDLPYFHASIRVPTIVLRELELARRQENQAKSSSARCPSSLCSEDLFGQLVDRQRVQSEKSSNPRRRVSFTVQSGGLANPVSQFRRAGSLLVFISAIQPDVTHSRERPYVPEQ
jgi:hypothetical protein